MTFKPTADMKRTKNADERKFGFYTPYIEASIDLTAGSAGGIACVLVGQPLDTIKVKLQTFPELYKNSLFCFKQTFVNENIRGLYAGTVPALIANVAENSVLFCAYGGCQSFISYVVGKPGVQYLNPLENAFAGFFASFFSTFSLCPTELVKCRLQAMRETNLRSKTPQPAIGPWLMAKMILRNEGIPGFFRGLAPTFVREMPGYFFFFGAYEISRALMTPRGKTKDEIGPIKTIIAGGIGGVALWTSIFPFDVVKSRIQVAGSKEPMILLIRNILRNDGLIQKKIENQTSLSTRLTDTPVDRSLVNQGIRALYKGLGPTLLRTFPASGALFLAYEYTRKCLFYVTGIEKD